MPLLKNPSVALTGGCGMGMRGVGVPARGCCRAPSPISGAEALRLCGQHPHRKLLRSLKTPEGKKGPGTETLPAAARTQGVVWGGRWDRMALGNTPGTGTPPAMGPV